MSVAVKPRSKAPKRAVQSKPRKSEETLTQFAERLWERRRKEFIREIHADSKPARKSPK